jgi:uncharacterized coiled-coil DUF342 family protein
MKIPESWTKEQTLEKLQKAHEQENEFNKEMSEIDKLFRQKNIRKAKLQKLISKNMKYRNQLIKML